MPSVVSLVSHRPLTACSGESTAAGHGAWPPVLLFRLADPPRPILAAHREINGQE